MKLKSKPKKIQETIETASDLRRFLADIAIAVAHKSLPIKDAQGAINACREINASVNTEIKHAALQIAAKKASYALGALPLQLTNNDKKAE